MRIKTISGFPLCLVLLVLLFGVVIEAKAEQCVDCVRAVLPWTKNIKPSSGYAKDWINAANGFRVDKNPSGCSDSKPCVLVYQPSYGNGINATAGHVAVYYGGSKIKDSNGICNSKNKNKKDRQSCNSNPDFSKAAYVIHPK